MRARPASLQFDWLKAGLSMDLLVFVYSNTKTGFKGAMSLKRKHCKSAGDLLANWYLCGSYDKFS